MDPNRIREMIEKGVSTSLVKVDGDGAHFAAVVVSEEFRGKSPVADVRVARDGFVGNKASLLRKKCLSSDFAGTGFAVPDASGGKSGGEPACKSSSARSDERTS